MKKQVKVMLVTMFNYEDLGTKIISSLLNKHNFETVIVYLKEQNTNVSKFPTEKELDLFFELIKREQPEVVGFGFKSCFSQYVNEITKQLRQRLYKGKIIYGGVHAILCSQECIEHADLVCTGEGEHAMLELCRRIAEGESYNDLTGFWVRQGDKIYKNPVRPLIEDLDSLPIPDFENRKEYFIDMDIIATDYCEASRDPGDYYQIISSRGCPFRCTFCGNTALISHYKGKGRYLRRRSPEHVVAELELAKKYTSRHKVLFNDDVFCFDENWVNDFVKEYKKRVNLPFRALTHPRFTDPEILSKLKDAGLFYLKMGIQSGSSRTRKEVFDLRTKDEEILEAADTIHKLGITKEYDVIMDNPWETRKDKAASIKMFLKLDRPFYLSTYSMVYYPKTVLTERGLDEGKIAVEDVDGWGGKSLQQTIMSGNYERSREDEFYFHIIELIRAQESPNWLIKFFFYNPYFRLFPNQIVFWSNIGVLGYKFVAALVTGKLTVTRIKRGVTRMIKNIV